MTALWLWSFPSVARAETVSLRPSADTTLLEFYPTNNFGGNEFMNSGTTQNFTRNRALVRFDIAGAVPRGSRILVASVSISVVGQPGDGSTPSNFALQRMLRDWGEGNKSGHPSQQAGLGKPATTNEATWLSPFAFTTHSWAAAGGAAGVDFSTNASSEAYVYGTDFSPYTFDTSPAAVADVQMWLNQPETNFGWMLRSQAEESDFAARRFASREDTNRAPVLTLEYVIVKIDRITASDGVVQLQFNAEAGQPCTVQYSDSLSPVNWLTLTNIPASPVQTTIVVSDIPVAPQRCYRLELP